MNKAVLVLLSLCGITVGSYSITAISSEIQPQYDQKTLAQVEAFYGIDESAAITRLSKEYDAAVQARRIEERHLPGYAGAWFDSVTLSLQVATNNAEDLNVIRQIGATPVLVTHSLTELEEVRARITDALTSAIGAGGIRKSYVDPQANGVVLGVGGDVIVPASAFIATYAKDVPVQVNSVIVDAGFSTDLHGADGTQNDSWHVTYGGTWPCSAGASAEQVNGSTYVAGFATAGHCDTSGNTIKSSSGTTLGTVAQSTYSITGGIGSFSFNEDGSWVQTSSGWVPKPQINGYTSGTLNVSGTWTGTLVAPVGTTACRYGSTSGGPHCASVTARNVSVTVGGYLFNGMIEVDGICTDDGDSGGPLVTPANQVQGTVTGGTPNSCPDSSGDYVYFQPITTTLARAESALGNPVAMLTSHGRSAPTVTNFRCPDPNNSGVTMGVHVYTCNFDDYDSQGETTMSWTTNTGASSNDVDVSGTCTTGQTVNVTLAISNPYGTATKPRSFTCPNYPMP